MTRLALLDGVEPTVPASAFGEWPPPLTDDEVKEHFAFLTAERRWWRQHPGLHPEARVQIS